MKIVTSEMMRALDRRAMEEGGIPGVVLMENAGRAVFDFLAGRFGPPRERRFHVLCGAGNNGGDGFVVARYLRLAGASVEVALVGDAERIRGDARVQFDVMNRAGVQGKPFGQADLSAQGIKVDALLGTGIQGAPRPDVADAIRWMNADRRPTISIDIPSGVDSDTGAVPGEAVRAAATVTFGYPKLGLFLPPGADCVGELVVRDIGFAWDVLESETPYRWLRPDMLRRWMPPRPRESHKGLFGHLLIVGGSQGMSGAPTLAARAALRTGAGLVTVAAPASAQALIAGKIDEAMTRALPERNGALCAASFDAIRELAEKCDALSIGPGATQEPEAQELIVRLLRDLQKPVVLDADGLNALAGHPQALEGRTMPTILTPHPGECGRLLETTAREIEADRVRAVRAAAARYRAVVVLKGARTLVCDGRRPQSEELLPVAVNTTGNPGMATGGSGDTLTGIVGALLAPGRDAYDAACLGVYLHGSAGDLAATENGEAGLVAGDIIAALPHAMRCLAREWEEVA